MKPLFLAALAALVLATAPDVASAADKPDCTCTHATDGNGAVSDALDTTPTLNAEVAVLDACDVATPEVAAPDVGTNACTDGDACASTALDCDGTTASRKASTAAEDNPCTNACDDVDACTTDASSRLRHLPYGGESPFIMRAELPSGIALNSSGICDDGNAGVGLVIAGREAGRTSIAEID